MAKPHILVTGGNGLIGTSFVKTYQDHFEFTVIDIADSKSSDHQYTIYDSVTNIEMYSEDISSIDGVIHLAAISRVISGEFQVEETWETNVGGTQYLLNFLAERDEKPWIIYGGSREVYGEPKTLPVSENHTCLPINRYGISKLAAEQLIQYYGKENQSSTAVLRFSNVYGNLYDQMDRVIPKFVIRALQGKNLELQGGTNSFDFTSIEDTIDGIFLTIKFLQSQLMVKNYVFNICTGTETTLQQLGQLIVDITKSNSRLIETSPRTYDVKHFCGSYSLAEEFLGYKPKVTLEAGVKKLFNQIENSLPLLIRGGEL